MQFCVILLLKVVFVLELWIWSFRLIQRFGPVYRKLLCIISVFTMGHLGFIWLFDILRASHTAKTHESRTNYAQIFVSARSVRRVRNSSVERTWTVSDCKCMCVEGGLCVILSFERFKIFPTHNCASVCVIHALFMRRVCVTMRGTRVGRQWLCVGTGSKPRTSTSVHWRPTCISRMNRAHITFIPLTSTDNHLQNWRITDISLTENA